MRKIIGKFFVIAFIAVLVLTTGSLAATDTTSPRITANPAGGTVAVGTTVKITLNDPESKIVSASYDCSGIKQTYNNAAANTWTINLTNFNIPGKTYTVVVVAENEVGLEAEKTFTYYVESENEEDTTKPVITSNVSSGSTILVGDTVKITIKDNESKIVSASYDCNGITSTHTSTPANTWTINLKAFNLAKTYTVKVTAENEAGLTVTKSFTFYAENEETEEIDEVVPTISIDPNSGVLEALENIELTLKDNVALKSVKYNWNSASATTKNLSGTVQYVTVKAPSTTGTNRLYVTVEDTSGNTTSRIYTYTIPEEEKDTTKPVITVDLKSGSTIYIEDNQEVVVTIKDTESKIISASYDLEGIYQLIEDQAAHTWYIKVKGFNRVKTFNLVIVAKNEVGLTETKTFTYYVVNREVPDEVVPTIIADPNSGVLEALGNIELTLEDNEALKSVKYNWNSASATTKTLSGTVQYVDVKAPSTPGTHRLYVTVVDTAGNTTSRIYTYTIPEEENIDEEAPTVSANPNSGTIEAMSIVKVTAKDNEALKTLRYNWNSDVETVRTISGTTATSNVVAPSVPGTHRLYVTVVDANGNDTSKTFTYYIAPEEVVDEEAPTVKANPSSGDIEPASEITLTVEDDVKLARVRYNWDDVAGTTKAISGTVYTAKVEAPITAGKHVLHVVVTDASGNETSKDFTYNVIDNVAPTISVNPVNKSTVVGGRVIKATLRDDVELARVEYNWKGDNVSKQTLSGTYSVINLPAIATKAGTYNVYITVVDASGNKTSGVYTYYVEDDDDDNGDIPEVDADPSKGTLEYGDRITITAEDDDGIDYVEYYWDDEDDKVKKYDDEFTVKVPSEEGKHYLYVRATDEKGNRCPYERFVYTIEENNYPGNPDIEGELNTKVRELRVEIRNADDKIKFEPQEEILYYVDYYNGSSSKVNNAKIVVELPNYLEGIDTSDDGKITSTKITWNLGTLDKGEYGRVSFTAQYTTDRYNEKIITVPAKIYSGSTLRDTSTVRNLIYCDDGSGTGSHEAYCIGYPSGTFRPSGNITRAELATMVANIEGISSSSTRSYFADVNGHWAAGNIEACVERGYMKSIGYNTFAPERYATRADLAYAIAAILDVEDLEPIFIYSSDLKNSDARCAMEQLLRLGIMDGYSDGTSKPNKNITRAEAVVIINNYLFRGELYTNGYRYSYNYDVNYNYGGSNYILKFTDLPMSHWAYGHIMEATNDHRYQRVLDGNEEML